MFSLSSLVQKAQAFIDPSLLSPGIIGGGSSGAELFRYQFRLPSTQSPLQDIPAELTLPLSHSARNSKPSGTDSELRIRGPHYVGRLHLSENFLCFSTHSTSFLPSQHGGAGSGSTGAAHGAGPTGNGFTLPLCTIKRVERLHSQNYTFALAITTWNGMEDARPVGTKTSHARQKLTIQLAGSRQACERFCDGLKKGLREGVKDVEKMRQVVTQCYSEYLMSTPSDSVKEGLSIGPKKLEAPDAGLGTIFRYPGDARKLRDRSKMRLWREYFRGWYLCPMAFPCSVTDSTVIRQRSKSGPCPAADLS